MRRLTALATAVALAATVATTASAAASLTGPRVPVLKAGAQANPGAPANKHVLRRAVSARAASALGPNGELRAVALNDTGPASRALLSSVVDFPKMAKEGITSVSIYIYLNVNTPNGTQVGTGVYTPTDAELQAVTTAAQLSGLDVQFMPVLIDSGNTWRGLYSPVDHHAFFASYTPQILHYADLAQTLGVKLFYVGSENRYLEQDRTNWFLLIKAVRQHYKGAVSYLAIPATFKLVKFWDLLDLAAVSPYFSMGEDQFPTYERDISAWNSVHSATVAGFVRFTRTPLIYGEVGYNSQAGSYSVPAASAKRVGKPAPAAQADAYRALLDVLARTPGVYGVTWWRWTVGTSIADMTYSPNGKPAECVIAARWSGDETVRALASLPVCDLHALDALLAQAPIPTLG